MQANEKLIGLLNDLTRINNDRFESYKNALKATNEQDQDIHSLFLSIANQSRKNTSALIGQLLKLRTAKGMGAALTGNVYRGWLQLKKDFAATDRHSLLDYSVYIESLVHKAYDTATQPGNDLPEDIRHLLNGQKRSLTGTYNLIRSHQPFEKAVA